MRPFLSIHPQGHCDGTMPLVMALPSPSLDPLLNSLNSTNQHWYKALFGSLKLGHPASFTQFTCKSNYP